MPDLMRRRASIRNRQGGFTVIELLVSMIFIGVLFAAFAMVLSSTLRHNDEVREESTAQAEVRAAIDRFAQDLRQAYSGDDDTWPIESISDTSIQFLSPDRATPFHLRRLVYGLSGGVFSVQMATSSDTDGWPWVLPPLGAAQSLVGSVTNTAVFTYFDENGVQLTPSGSTVDDVRTVNVTLTVRTFPGTPGRQYTYDSSVSLRAT